MQTYETRDCVTNTEKVPLFFRLFLVCTSSAAQHIGSDAFIVVVNARLADNSSYFVVDSSIYEPMSVSRSNRTAAVRVGGFVGIHFVCAMCHVPSEARYALRAHIHLLYRMAARRFEMKSTFSGFSQKSELKNKNRAVQPFCTHARTPLKLNVCTRGRARLSECSSNSDASSMCV